MGWYFVWQDNLGTNGNLRTRNGVSARRCFLDYKKLGIKNYVRPGLKGILAAHQIQPSVEKWDLAFIYPWLYQARVEIISIKGDSTSSLDNLVYFLIVLIVKCFLISRQNFLGSSLGLLPLLSTYTPVKRVPPSSVSPLCRHGD